jgi:hemolysin D
LTKLKLRFEEQQRSYNSLVHSGELALLKSQEQLKNIDTQVTTLKAEIAQNKSQIEFFRISVKSTSLSRTH